MLGDAGFIVKKGEPSYSDEYEKGTVMACDPKPGTEAEKGTDVTITISLGEEPVKTAKVPDLRNKSASNAESLLSDAGLYGSSSEEYSDTVEKGYVISQSVDPGEEVDLGTTISYVVSRGPQTKYTNIPSDILGMDENAAETAIREAGLTAQYMEEEYSDQYAAGQVCRVALRYSTGSVSDRNKLTLRRIRLIPEIPRMEAAPRRVQNSSRLPLAGALKMTESQIICREKL